MMDTMSLTLVIGNGVVPESRELDGTLALMGEDEFRAFYERTARPLWSYLSRITGDRQQADDLVQEAFYRFYRAGRRHENEAHRRNSLFQIATNLVRDAARRRKGYEEVVLNEDPEIGFVPRSEAPSPEQDTAVRTDVARAMQQLDPAQRELLWLAYAQGASHEEIAQVMGVRAISVRTLLFRARKKLAVLLEGKGKEQ
jgi:RNA polymerase sigma-70 factor, ECF subfamily